MRKVLLDTSTYLDLHRAAKNRRKSWAQNTLRHVIAYWGQFPQLTISAYTVFEVLEGIYRQSIPGAAEEFLRDVVPGFEVIYPNEGIMDLGAKITASLANSRQGIGIVDSIIAATAIHEELTLITANTNHFPRIQVAGFRIDLGNWREE